MANKLYDPEWKTQLRRREVQKLKFSVSFDRLLPRETVDPTYKYEFDVLDDAIKVTKSTTGKSGARSIVGIDRADTDLFFYMAEMDMGNWADRWMADRRSASTLPIPIQTRVDPRRAASLMLGDVLREMDTDFWTTIVAQDAAPASIGSDPVTTVAGRQAFLETLHAELEAMSDTFVEGRVVLAVDRGKLFHFGMPFAYSDNTGTATGSGPSLASLITAGQDGVPGIPIVPVNNPILAGKAVLHFQEQDNAAFLHSTPGGVEVQWGQVNDTEVLRVFHHAGFVAYRDNTVTKHTQVLTGL